MRSSSPPLIPVTVRSASVPGPVKWSWISPGGTFVSTNVPFGLTGAVMSVPTTATVIPGPTSEAKLLSLRLSAERAAPVIEPLIVARFPVVGIGDSLPDSWPGADGAEGDDDPHALVPN